MRDTICKNFNRLVVGSKIPNREIARLTGVSESTFYRWLKGEHAPEVPNVEKLAEILKISPFEFYRPINEIIKPNLKLSELAKQLANIPDDVFELAQEFDSEDDCWESLRVIMKKKLERKKAAMASKRLG